MKKNKNFFVLHIVISVLIIIFLPQFVSALVSKYPDAYPGDEGSISNLTFDLANKLAIFIWPVLIGYVMLIYVTIKNKVGSRKIHYPLSFLTLLVILFNLGIIYFTYMFLWYVVLLALPIFITFIILIILGNMKDKNNVEGINVVKKVIKILLIVITVLTLLSVVPSLIETTKEPKYENLTPTVINEFENKFINNYIGIKDINISEDNKTIYEISFAIKNENLPESELDFANEIISNYKQIKNLLIKYNYNNDSIHFYFDKYNPYNYSNAEAYKNGGYIKDQENAYYIFLDGKALIIEKDGN